MPAQVSTHRCAGPYHKAPVTVIGRSVYVTYEGTRYRLNGEKYWRGDYQVRGTLAFRKWDDRSERLSS